MPGFLLLKVSSIMQSQKEIIFNYRKIPNISPGLIEVRKHILGGLYFFLGWAYILRAFCVSESGAYIRGACIRWGLTFGLLRYVYLRTIYSFRYRFAF